MPTRTDLGRRARKKSLMKKIADKKQNPDKYCHDMTEYSVYLGLDFDFKHRQLNSGKMVEYERLKAIYGDINTKHGG